MPYHTVKYSSDGPVISANALREIEGDDTARRVLTVKLNTAHTSVKTDHPGWLYVYYLEGDDDATYFKIGCTSQSDVATRIAQWPGATLRYAVKVPFNMLAERLVFALLDKYRLFRYVFTASNSETPNDDAGVARSGKRYLSVWKSSGKVLQDASHTSAKNAAADDKKCPYTEHVRQQLRTGITHPTFGTRKKEIEWFKVPFTTIELVLTEVAKAVTSWAKTGK
jgi:hypothetical protein